MSTNYGKAKEDKKRLNEEIKVLERSLSMRVLECPMVSLKTNRKRCKRSYAHGNVKQEKPRRRSPMKSTIKTKDARHLKKIEELRAIARNEHESLEIMVRTL